MTTTPIALRLLAGVLLLASCAPQPASGQTLVPWPQGDSLTAQVVPTITTTAQGVFRIEYRVGSAPNSQQPIEMIVIINPAAGARVTGPRGWDASRTSIQDSSAAVWFAQLMRFMVRAGDSVSGLVVEGAGVLEPVSYYLKGYYKLPDAPDEGQIQMERPTPIWQNAARGATIGVVDPASSHWPLDPAPRSAALLALSCDQGWISPTGICVSLRAKLPRGNQGSGNDPLRPFRAEVEAQRGKQIPEAVAAMLLSAAGN